uniref:Uncharacterized protein n=1 Tax=Anguilla anguilla TaxID=7936 RepID=A0A0E9X9V0_ANGAN
MRSLYKPVNFPNSQSVLELFRPAEAQPYLGIQHKCLKSKSFISAETNCRPAIFIGSCDYLHNCACMCDHAVIETAKLTNRTPQLSQIVFFK